MLTFHHYCSNEVNWCLDGSYPYPKKDEKSFKPSGLWFSIQGSEKDFTWKEWCWDMEFRIHRLRKRYNIIFKKEINVIRLSSHDEVSKFSSEFASSVYGNEQVNWEKIREKYSGFMVYPYNWNEPFSFWYSGLDGACGCVWNLDVIESITLDTKYKIGD